MKKVIIFTIKQCIHCEELKNILNNNKIPYTELDINDNKELWDMVKKETGYNRTPTTFLKEEFSDDGIIYVPGRDYETKEELLDILKTQLSPIE